MCVCVCVSAAEVSASVEEGSLRLELEDLRRGEGHSSRIVVGTVHEGLPMEEQKKEGQVERDHREKREEKVNYANFDTAWRTFHNTHTHTITHAHTQLHTHTHITHTYTHTHTHT